MKDTSFNRRFWKKHRSQISLHYRHYNLRYVICFYLGLITHYVVSTSFSHPFLSSSMKVKSFAQTVAPCNAWIPQYSAPLPVHSSSFTSSLCKFSFYSSSPLSPNLRYKSLNVINNLNSKQTSSQFTSKINNSDCFPSPCIPVLSFPGGGIYFYWQAGIIEYLREKNYDLSQVDFVGASAGALTSTLAACNVNFYHATDVAVALCDKYNVWDRPLGLMGIWGNIVEEWLDIILPDNAHELCTDNKVNIYILKVSFNHRPKRVIRSHFNTRKELIQVCLTSVHIPWFMNKRFSKRLINFNNVLHELTEKKTSEEGVMERYIDGSFLLSNEKLKSYGNKYDRPTIIFDHKDNTKAANFTSINRMTIKDNQDRKIEYKPTKNTIKSSSCKDNSFLTKEGLSNNIKAYEGEEKEKKYKQADNLNRNSPTDMVTLLSPTGVHNLIREGYQYAEWLDSLDTFEGIPKLKKEHSRSTEMVD